MSDPADDQLERIALIRRLDLLAEGVDPKRWADPAIRTINGRPLTEAEAALLLSCTLDDEHLAAEAMNQRADLLRQLTAVTEEFTDRIRSYVSPGGGYEGALANMPVDERRLARELLNRMRLLKGMLGLPID